MFWFLLIQDFEEEKFHTQSDRQTDGQTSGLIEATYRCLKINFSHCPNLWHMIKSYGSNTRHKTGRPAWWHWVSLLYYIMWTIENTLTELHIACWKLGVCFLGLCCLVYLSSIRVTIITTHIVCVSKYVCVNVRVLDFYSLIAIPIVNNPDITFI